MPRISIAPYFPFPRVKIVSQELSPGSSVISVRPDERFVPLCGRCGEATRRQHSSKSRLIRDLDLAGFRVWLDCHIRNLFCSVCGRIRVEKLEFVDSGERVTKRFARYVYGLCRLMPISDVACQTGLDPKTVKAIDKLFLKEDFGRIDFSQLRLVAVDEVSERKGHRYLTLVLNYETGQILYVGKKRRARTLKKFFRMLSRRQRRGIQAVALDMWDPYIKAVQHYCPTAKIVFDLFHVKKEFSRAINTVRGREYRQAKEADKAVIKGSRYLLLSNRERLSRKQIFRLEQLLEINASLATMYLLKDQLNVIWKQISKEGCAEALDDWVRMARESKIREAIAFAKRLRRYSYGILNHALFPIHTGKLEGINNTVKVIKRRSYGFRDTEYFSLKIKQAFPGKNFN